MMAFATRFILVFAVVIMSAKTGRAELSESEIGDLFSQGKELFRRANDLMHEDAVKSRELYGKAALRFERIVREGGIRNGKLYYNLGNAYFRVNDIGRAILNYRLAQQFIPNDPNLQQNLDYARKRRMDRVEVSQKSKALRAAFFWHYDFSTKTRSTVFMLAFLLVWVAAGVRLFWRRATLNWIMGVSAVISLLFLASLIAESVSRGQSAAGVVIAEEAVARKGDSESYEPSFKEPLHSGTEFDVVEDRGEWLHVRLADSRTCWLPLKVAGLVK